MLSLLSSSSSTFVFVGLKDFPLHLIPTLSCRQHATNERLLSAVEGCGGDDEEEVG